MACGDERWQVKTLTDLDVARIDFDHPVITTVAALNALTAHCSSLPDARTFAEEFAVLEVVGRVTLTRLEDDRDLHVVISDPSDSTQTMVTEVADPECAATSPKLGTLQVARAQYQALSPLTGKLVRLRGVGFYDFAHGQTGRSRSCIELHPVLNIALLGP